jgi:FkbM family methyltransferase
MLGIILGKGWGRMEIAETMKRISYSPLIGACIRLFGLRKVMQWIYAKVRRNPGVVKFSLHGVEAIFSARTPVELRCVEGTWFSETEMLTGVLSGLRAGDAFLDVGSNLGVFTVFAAKVVGPGGRVVAFEPETTAHSRLIENIGLNNLHNVRALKQALSDTRATRRLVLGDAGAVSQSAHIADDIGPSEAVETADYDWLVANQSLPIPRLVKMDIEGHEFEALKGMGATLSNPACAALFCEIHPLSLPKDVSPEQVVELIRSFGFDSIQTKKRSGQLHSVATRQIANRTSGES